MWSYATDMDKKNSKSADTTNNTDKINASSPIKTSPVDQIQIVDQTIIETYPPI